MKYTETKLNKIVRIGMARIDQVFDKCCADLEALKYRPSERMERLKRDANSSLQANLDLRENQRLRESARLQRQAIDISGARWGNSGAIYEQMRGIQNYGSAGQAGLVGQATHR